MTTELYRVPQKNTLFLISLALWCFCVIALFEVKEACWKLIISLMRFCNNIKLLQFSPFNRHIMTWHRYHNSPSPEMTSIWANLFVTLHEQQTLAVFQMDFKMSARFVAVVIILSSTNHLVMDKRCCINSSLITSHLW